MANMSYCMFENTAGDMSQLVHRLDEVDTLAELFKGMSHYEREGVKRVLRLSREIDEKLSTLFEDADEYVGDPD